MDIYVCKDCQWEGTDIYEYGSIPRCPQCRGDVRGEIREEMEVIPPVETIIMVLITVFEYVIGVSLFFMVKEFITI